jgi:hypothetical protein
MDELKRALYALVYQAGLTEAEVANLTLQDVHLAGKEPAITILDDSTGSQRRVALNDEVRNVLVAWMLARPDRPVTLLFPGDKGESLTVEEIKTLLPEPETSEEASEGVTGAPSPQPVSSRVMAEEGLPHMGPSVTRRTAAPPPRPPGTRPPLPFRVLPPPFGPEQISGRSRPESVLASTGIPEAKATPKTTSTRSTRLAPLAAIGIIALLICGGLIAGGYVTGPELLERLTGGRFFGAAETPLAQADETPSPTPTAPAEAPLATSPISTPTGAPTDTPAPTDTSTPAATDTPTPESTATPLPTDTPQQEATPEPTATPVPTDTPTPIPANTPAPQPNTGPPPTPTPGFKYAAPQLLSPEPDFRFIDGNTVDLDWAPVGELAPNEQYAVRLVYLHATEATYKGEQLQETLWTVPLNLYREADGPLYEYYWFVYVEQVQADGTAILVSPESEWRRFIWD